MKPSVKLACSLFVALFAVIELAYFASAQTTSPSAYVYVLNRLFNGPNTVELDGLRADSTGALTPLFGSPFWTSTAQTQYWTLAHSAHWLFASDGIFIYSFSIASNGALTLESSINAQQFAISNSYEIEALFLDRSGSTLYATEFGGAQQGTFLVARTIPTTLGQKGSVSSATMSTPMTLHVVTGRGLYRGVPSAGAATGH